ncbi:DNA polymerase III subunit delta [Clostridium sp. SHJSY1]|uniref:DNA polymerase III subunit delta n=1 Tax=Clostridium sp. SHJSY1 TaxID=2942483 RepID=UPI0028768B97|nr:DNA polymerase III subunit delta [Clostridium sp. SHJSY1]MDS0524073.1 DNA polymerase III subunit delta [Clostridium sp. SHJSY1]
MITSDIFEKEIKNKSIKNSYVFCGGDEELIKEGIEVLSKPILIGGFEDLNYIRIDGLTATMDDIMNACETMPFMGEKKVVLVYRANFLRDKTDSSSTKLYNGIKEYLKDMPNFTVFIMYYVFNDKRENPKKNKKLMALDKITEIVHFEKLKRDRFVRKVEDVFSEKGKNIGKIELRYFCERVQNNFNVIRREVDKLIDYTVDREIKKEDIDKLIPSKSEDDIFDLVDLISQRKIEKAIDIMDDLLFKADQHMLIVTSIESQFKKLYNIKLGMEKGKKVNDFMSELRVPAFVCEKLMNLSSKFSRRQLEDLIKLSVKTEARLKSSGVDKTMELELLLLNTLMIKK